MPATIPAIKICGIKTPDAIAIAAQSGARMVGFVFVDASPRFIHPEQARILARQIPTGIRSVGLFADADDETLARVLASVPLDMIQLHGAETPARVQAIKSRFALPVIKAFPVASAEDVAAVAPYLDCVDWILFDAKPPTGAKITGGHGVAFDWTILRDKKFAKPWMLSGGLTAENVGDALSILSPDAVDVSSGVESARGVKDMDKIRAFCAAIR